MRRRRFPTVLVGPSSLVQEGLTKLLCGAGFQIVASDRSVHHLAGAARRHECALLIINSTGDVAALAEEISLFKQQRPTSRVAALVDRYQVPELVPVFRAGANVCFMKSTAPDVFLKTLELVMLGETILPFELLGHVQSGAAASGQEPITHESEGTSGKSESADDYVLGLSPHEKRILRYLAEGSSNKIIARTIQIAEGTVKGHVKSILRKLRACNRTQAAIWAIANSSLIWPDGPAVRVAALTPPPLVPGAGIEQPEATAPADAGPSPNGEVRLRNKRAARGLTFPDRTST